MTEVCRNSLDHTFKRHDVFQSISRVFHHTQMHAHTCTCTLWGDRGALAFQLIRKREALVSWVLFCFFTLISSGCWGRLNIWWCCVCDGEGSVRSDCMADQLTGLAPWILGWKGIAWCLGYAMLGALSFLNKTHLNKVQLIRLAWLIRFLSRLLASTVRTSCPGYAASA